MWNWFKNRKELLAQVYYAESKMEASLETIDRLQRDIIMLERKVEFLEEEIKPPKESPWRKLALDMAEHLGRVSGKAVGIETRYEPYSFNFYKEPEPKSPEV